MFWDKYFALCSKIGKSPNAVAKEIGISSGTLTGWKKHNKVPLDMTIKKVADYFGVPVSYFSEEAPETEKAPMPNDIGEENILRMYRSLSTAEKGAWYAYALSLKEKQKEGK
jgi:transcriptional regulator with XRE-family HTH domain